MLYHMDICTGIGGFALALKHLVGGFQTVCYVEIDKYCQQVLWQRIHDGTLDHAPMWDDLRTFDGAPWRGAVDIITAGFPCQPFSVAGRRAGADDDRNLWPEVARVIGEVRPGIVFLENVPALLSNGYYGTVVGDLAACGYDTRWDCIPASACGANHQRDRLWILATRRGVSDAGGDGVRVIGECGRGEHEECGATFSGYDGSEERMGHTVITGLERHAGDERDGTGWKESSRPVSPPSLPRREDPDTNSGGCEVERIEEHGELESASGCEPDGLREGRPGQGARDGADAEGEPERPGLREGEPTEERGRRSGDTRRTRTEWWDVEPDVGRVAHGVPSRVDRLRALGNAVVPEVVRVAWETLTRR